MATHKNIIDLKDLDQTEFTTSVCVVGSGAGGGVLALTLASYGIETLLVEAGDTLMLSHSDDFIDRVNTHNPDGLNFGFSKQLGGSSNLWAGRTALFEESDMIARNWIPNEGWPITREELEPYYKKTADIVGIPDYKLFKEQEAAPFDLKEGLETKSFQWAKSPFNVQKYLKQHAPKHKNLTVLLNAPVKELNQSDENKAITSITVQGEGGRTISIQAQNYILAAGGIETPRLMLNATDVQKNGIGNDNDQVGRYFSTHPKANVAALVMKKRVPLQHPLFNNKPAGDGFLRQGLGFTCKTQQDEKLLNHYVQLSPLMEYNANQMFEKIKGATVVSSKFIDRSKIVRGMLPGLGLLVFEIFERIVGVQRKAKKFILRGFLDQIPNKENRITLSDEQDELGNYKANIQWTFTEEDKASVLHFFDKLDSAVKASNIGHIEYEPLKTMKDWPLTEIHSHFMGTTRMGTSPENAVTDTNAKVFGIDNLYISGPSLFPTYGFANPFYTIIALSLRLADHIRTLDKT